MTIRYTEDTLLPWSPSISCGYVYAVQIWDIQTKVPIRRTSRNLPHVCALLLHINDSDGRGNGRRERKTICQRDTSQIDKRLCFRRTRQNAHRTCRHIQWPRHEHSSPNVRTTGDRLSWRSHKARTRIDIAWLCTLRQEERHKICRSPCCCVPGPRNGETC